MVLARIHWRENRGVIIALATLAQMVERFTCNEDVVSSILTGGSSWRGDRVAYRATLEMLCCGNATVGSNPTFSAIFFLTSHPK